MKFKSNTIMTEILDNLFKVYESRVPNVRKITQAMINEGFVTNQQDIINDHIAFRTMGVNNLGIESFEKIFLGILSVELVQQHPRQSRLCWSRRKN